MFLDDTGANGGLGQGGDQEGGRRPGYGVLAAIVVQRHRLAAATAASPTKKNITKLNNIQYSNLPRIVLVYIQYIETKWLNWDTAS
jgi:hypothetical protein